MQKKSVSLGYTKAKIKPFFNPLFGFSAVIISVFFFGLWQYSQNPDLFTRETGLPKVDSENNNSPQNNSPENLTSENQINEANLTDEELSLLVDIDNIGNLFQEVQLNSVVKGTSAENPDFFGKNIANITDFDNVGTNFKEVKLNPLLSPTKTNNKNNNQKNNQKNLFQEFLKSDNLSINNPLITDNSNRQNQKIDIIRPEAKLPSLNDLTARQKVAMENDPLKQALQNRNLYAPKPLNTSNINTINGVNNSVNGLGNNGINSNSVIPNNPIISGNNVPNNLGTIPNSNTINNNMPNTLGTMPNTNTINNIPQNMPQNNGQPGFVSYY